METVIDVKHVWKQYRLGEIGTGTLAQDLHRSWARLLGRDDPYAVITEENDTGAASLGDRVWVLKNIDFKIHAGEIVGIIGHNGAGKSTFLKILSRTTLPTKGSINVKGRLASLLEVGTGFHPDLSGRDNIFLNGAILGMTRAEIIKKFDEIVAFSEVEQYIDTPVKRYSSGMYVRLAFSVAAHLEPEILIIDEVLAVGDSEFQKKALRKMKDVSTNDGRTVIVVSHSMPAIQSIATRVIQFKKGVIANDGLPDKVINEYLRVNNPDESDLMKISEREGNGKLKFSKAIIKSEDSNDNLIESFSRVAIEVDYIKDDSVNANDLRIDMDINNAGGIRVAWLSTYMLPEQFKFQSGKVTFNIDTLSLGPGNYTISLWAEEKGTLLDWVQYVMEFRVQDLDYFKSGKSVRNLEGKTMLKYTVSE